MVIGKLSATTAPLPIKPKSGFKAVLLKKRARISGLEKSLDQISRHHGDKARTFSSFMANADYSPQKLLAIQYKTGVLLLREQMFCKTAELCSNTFKNFTQMQV